MHIFEYNIHLFSFLQWNGLVIYNAIGLSKMNARRAKTNAPRGRQVRVTSHAGRSGFSEDYY